MKAAIGSEIERQQTVARQSETKKAKLRKVLIWWTIFFSVSFSRCVVNDEIFDYEPRFIRAISSMTRQSVVRPCESSLTRCNLSGRRTISLATHCKANGTYKKKTYGKGIFIFALRFNKIFYYIGSINILIPLSKGKPRYFYFYKIRFVSFVGFIVKIFSDIYILMRFVLDDLWPN